MHQKQIGHQAKAKIKRDYEISHIIAFSMHSRDYVGIIFYHSGIHLSKSTGTGNPNRFGHNPDC